MNHGTTAKDTGSFNSLLVDLRSHGPRKVFVFRDRPSRRTDVIAFYADDAAVRPLAFCSTIKDMKALLHNA